MNGLKLQSNSQGVEIDQYTGSYRICEFREEGVNAKEELYVFRCSAEKFCCGRECCLAEPDALPLWALILLVLLSLVLLVCIVSVVLYMCKKRHSHKLVVDVDDLEKSHGPCEKGGIEYNKNGGLGEREMLVNHARPDLASYTDFESSTGREPSSEPCSSDHTQVLQLTSVSNDLDDTIDSRKLRGNNNKAVDGRRHRFSAVKETYEQPPDPIEISYHADTEQRPVVSEMKIEEQKAKLVYYTPSMGRVAAYNDDFQE